MNVLKNISKLFRQTVDRVEQLERESKAMRRDLNDLAEFLRNKEA